MNRSKNLICLCGVVILLCGIKIAPQVPRIFESLKLNPPIEQVNYVPNNVDDTGANATNQPPQKITAKAEKKEPEPAQEVQEPAIILDVAEVEKPEPIADSEPQNIADVWGSFADEMEKTGIHVETSGDFYDDEMRAAMKAPIVSRSVYPADAAYLHIADNKEFNSVALAIADMLGIDTSDTTVAKFELSRDADRVIISFNGINPAQLRFSDTGGVIILDTPIESDNMTGSERRALGEGDAFSLVLTPEKFKEIAPYLKTAFLARNQSQGLPSGAVEAVQAAMGYIISEEGKSP